MLKILKNQTELFLIKKVYFSQVDSRRTDEPFFILFDLLCALRLKMESEKFIQSNLSLSINELNILWIINNAKSIFKLKVGESINSPTINDGDLQWNLKIYPSGEIDDSSIRIYITLRVNLDGVKNS